MDDATVQAILPQTRAHASKRRNHLCHVTQRYACDLIFDRGGFSRHPRAAGAAGGSGEPDVLWGDGRVSGHRPGGRRLRLEPYRGLRHGDVGEAHPVHWK
jgi:hypothetical protein